MASCPCTRRESDLVDVGRCECADQSHAVQGSVAAEENTEGRRTDGWLLTWFSGSVAEAGWSGGSAQAALALWAGDDGVEVGQQQVGKVLAVRGERVGRTCQPRSRRARDKAKTSQPVTRSVVVNAKRAVHRRGREVEILAWPQCAQKETWRHLSRLVARRGSRYARGERRCSTARRPARRGARSSMRRWACCRRVPTAKPFTPQ